jgi:hypothetical protein
MSRWKWYAVVAVAAGGLGFLAGILLRVPTPAPAAPDEPPSLPVRPSPLPAPAVTSGLPPLLEAAAEKLTGAGWDEQTARVVIRFHGDWLTDLFDADRYGYDRALIRLSQLPQHGELPEVLREHPEYAGLFLLVKQPLALARELRGPDRELLAGLFLIHLAREDADALASALPGNAALIADLYRRGLAGAEAAFLFPREKPGAQEYEKWVRETMRSAINQPDEQLVGTFMLILEEGPTIRRLMAEDAAFLVKFPGLWDKLSRATKRRGDDVGLYIGLPGLWKFLDSSDAESLIADWGLLPVDLLYGEKDGRYPEAFHTRVKELLKKGDETIANLLLLCRGEAAFYPFLRENLPLDLLRGMADDLVRHKARLKDRLVTLQNKRDRSVGDLQEAVGLKPAGPKEYVPFYSLYKVYVSHADGEDLSALDLAFAAADLASVAVPAAKGLVVVKQGATAAARDVAKEGVKKLIKNEVAGAVKGKVRSETAAWLGTVGVNAFSVRLAAKRFMVEAVKDLKAALVRAIPKVELRVDVTGLLRYVYRQVGPGPLRRLAGLNPQVLLDSASRVYLRLEWSGRLIDRRQRALFALLRVVDQVSGPRGSSRRKAALVPHNLAAF